MTFHHASVRAADLFGDSVMALDDGDEVRAERLQDAAHAIDHSVILSLIVNITRGWIPEPGTSAWLMYLREWDDFLSRLGSVPDAPADVPSGRGQRV